MKVPFLDPHITKDDIRNAVRSIKSGWLVSGAHTRQFENALKKYLGSKDAVLVSSATAALHLSLILAGVGEGDEVITTPISWVATSNVILYQKAKPIFADIELDTGLIDIDEVEKKITKKTKAIIVVHTFGQMVDMKKLKRIADKHHIPIIEDAAHALESKRDGVRPGQLGFSACLSFHAAKNITSGQGGGYIANSLEHGNEVRLLRRDGVVNTGGRRHMIKLGYKYDLTDFQAALLTGQLGRIKTTNKKRKYMYDYYMRGFKGTQVKLPRIHKGSIHAYHMFVIFVSPEKRDMIRAELEKKGIETSIHYAPIHLETYYRETFGFKEGDFPNAEKFGASVITLPTHTKLTKKQQDFVIRSVLKLI